MRRPLAALFVETDTVYRRLGLDCWDAQRDARRYAGPTSAICHPPCKRYGRYWRGGPSVKVPHLCGDDSGCFEAALLAVRRYGGVVEHPEGSHAWRIYALPRPSVTKGRNAWVGPDRHGGWSVTVDQGAYGHASRKRTWLYAVGTRRPQPLLSQGGLKRLEPGFHSKEEAAQARAREDWIPPPRLTRDERIHTPEPFARFLVSLLT